MFIINKMKQIHDSNKLGLYISSAAYSNGLKAGDRIAEIDGVKAFTVRDFKEIIRNYRANDIIALTVLRDGEYIDIDMKVTPEDIAAAGVSRNRALMEQ